jgi:hypothetical protein
MARRTALWQIAPAISNIQLALLEKGKLQVCPLLPSITIAKATDFGTTIL